MQEERLESSESSPGQEDCKRHSAMGIASFAIAMLSWLAVFGFIAFAAVVETIKPGCLDNQDSPQSMLAGLLYIGCMLLCVIGTAVAIPGVCSKSAKRLYAIIGLCLNAATLVIEALVLLYSIFLT